MKLATYVRRMYSGLLILCLLIFSGIGKAQTVKPIVKVSEVVLESYVGSYAPSPNFILTFTKVGDHLNLAISGQPPIPFFPESQTKFFIKENPDVTVEFIKENGGLIDKVIMTQGRVMIANRLGVESYDPEKQYTIELLKFDFNFFRSTLEKVHPRLYEFTPKAEFDRYLDSLYLAINKPMDEIEFRYFLLLAVAKVHDGHTSLSQSVAFSQYRPSQLPPFTLYYEGQKAYIHTSADNLLKPGTEVLAINNVPIKKRLNDALSRVSGDGIHLNVQYSIINKPMNWFSYEVPYWFNVRDYRVTILNPDRRETEIQTKAIDMTEFIKRIPPPAPNYKNQLKISDDGKTAVLSYPRLDFPSDSIRNNFLNITFTNLKDKEVANLIIDLRGNGGGKPENAAYLLKYLMNRDFIYSNSTSIVELADLTKITKVDSNRFKGKMYFLIDGGSFSSTSHLLSLVQYYKLGKLIGELSSGSYSSNTIGFPYFLPNSKLILNCPDGIFETAVEGYDRAKGISPDYEVKNTLVDILNKNDKAIEFTHKLINEN